MGTGQKRQQNTHEMAHCVPSNDDKFTVDWKLSTFHRNTCSANWYAWHEHWASNIRFECLSSLHSTHRHHLDVIFSVGFVKRHRPSHNLISQNSMRFIQNQILCNTLAIKWECGRVGETERSREQCVVQFLVFIANECNFSAAVVLHSAHYALHSVVRVCVFFIEFTL